jgi:hypothetical protein
MKLSGQEYVDEYARRAKPRLAKARRPEPVAAGRESADDD